MASNSIGGAAFIAMFLVANGQAAEPPAASPPVTPGFKLPAATPNDTLVSPRFGAAGELTLALYAPEARHVTLVGELLPWGTPAPGLAHADDGTWSITLHPAPGTYRYQFWVDGAAFIDSRNVATSRSQKQVRSLVHVPGNSVEDDAPVPHGAVAEVYYPSSTFSSPRRMHVYTPPGYGKDGNAYPVLYLLHGGGDSDDSWWTVGRAGFILDNLIAAGKARPMIVVMPAGHVPDAEGTIASAKGAMSEDPANDPFTDDLLGSILPFVEHNYRASDRRALAGLSMGGVQASNIGLLHPDLFPEVLVYSSGWFPDVRDKFERKWGKSLDAAATRLKLLWVGYGETDIARTNAEAALKMFDRHGLKVTSEMTPGGHEWANWRLYLSQTAPLLFR